MRVHSSVRVGYYRDAHHLRLSVLTSTIFKFYFDMGVLRIILTRGKKKTEMGKHPRFSMWTRRVIPICEKCQGNVCPLYKFKNELILFAIIFIYTNEKKTFICPCKKSRIRKIRIRPLFSARTRFKFAYLYRVYPIRQIEWEIYARSSFTIANVAPSAIIFFSSCGRIMLQPRGNCKLRRTGR